MESDNIIILKCFIHSKAISLDKDVHTLLFTFTRDGEEYELVGDCKLKEITNLFGDNTTIYQADLAGLNIMFDSNGTQIYTATQEIMRDFWNRLVKDHGFEKIKETI